jgi:uncharacterized protein YacL
MKQTFLVLRIFFFLLCICGSWVVAYVNQEMNPSWVVFVGACIGLLVILIDIYIKGFSLSGFTALTFGLAVGSLLSHLISSSPLFEPIENGEFQETVFLIRLVLTVGMMYLGAVIALRGRDEFYLVIPYVRFSPQSQQQPITLVDTSALIDGRLVAICKAKWLTHGLVIPSFVLQELHFIADSIDSKRRERGRRGLRNLNELKALNLDIRIHEMDLGEREKVDEKLILLASSMKARLLTTDYNLAQLAEFRGVDWLNLNELSHALTPPVEIGSVFSVDLIREGKELGQAIGYLRDGSMVVVNQGKNHIGRRVEVEIISVIPSSAGKMFFAELAIRSKSALDAPHAMVTEPLKPPVKGIQT